jgi:hypothetical protein
MQTLDELRRYVLALETKELPQFGKECGVQVNTLLRFRGGGNLQYHTALAIMAAIEARSAQRESN